MIKDIIKRVNDDRIDELELSIIQNLEKVECPLVHRFTEGMYIREIFMPKDSLITSKIHLTEHPFTISKGKVAVCIDGDNWQEFEEPYTGITKSGTRRVLYVIEDCIWTTYHLNPNNEQDLEKIEDRIIEKHTNELIENYKKDLLNIK